MIRYLEVDDLVEIASVVLGETPQIRDFGLLSSAVVRPATVVFGQEAYPDLWRKAAALLHSVCMNHALIDGNKRLAWAAARVFLALNEVSIQDVDVDQAEAFVMSVASGTMTEVPDVARELRKLYV
ncbi:Fic family protein [Micromonospora sp. WMMD980]|uniref:type II toxin-antitoxin system death-on-curing family toxin n=1 Tax=Micromonospora sp. WMMD980 TaxID=3016088 RepID=UPI002416456A|nr:Fic family protein [Micromonospora sp. WMMD980]MDG4802880.1 Fic family protein [Micromonospora sp. WMMD980]